MNNFLVIVIKKCYLHCYLPFDWLTERKRGFAFGDLSDHNSKKAIDDLQDVQGMGREIRDIEAEKRNGPNDRKYNKLNKNDSYFLHSE